MKKKWITGIVASALMAAVLAGCGSGGTSAGSSAASSAEAGSAAESASEAASGSSASANADGGHIGMVVPTLSDEFQINLTDKVKAWCDENGYDCDVASYEMDVKQMVAQIENMATLGVSDLYVGPMDVGSTQDALASLKDQDLDIIVAPGTGIDPECYDINMDINQFECGAKVAEMAAEWIDQTFPDAEDGSIEVAVVTSTANENTEQRGEGLKEVEKLTSKAKIVEEYDLAAESNPDAKTQEYIDGAFLSHPDLKVVLCLSGSTSIAANEVIMRTAGLNLEEMGLFSGDNLDAMLALIAQSESNDAVLRGCCGFENVPDAVIDWVSGKITEKDITEDTKTYYLKLLPITLDNLSEYYQG